MTPQPRTAADQLRAELRTVPVHSGIVYRNWMALLDQALIYAHEHGRAEAAAPLRAALIDSASAAHDLLRFDHPGEWTTCPSERCTRARAALAQPEREALPEGIDPDTQMPYEWGYSTGYSRAAQPEETP